MTQTTNELPKDIDYQANKKEIKKSIHEFIDHPDEHLKELNEDQITQIKKLNFIEKELLCKGLKTAVKENLTTLNADQLAKELTLDLEDSTIAMKNIWSLKILLGNPERPEYNLEPEMVKRIQQLSYEEKKALKKELMEDFNIENKSSNLFGIELTSLNGVVKEAISGLKDLSGTLIKIIKVLMPIVITKFGPLISDLTNKIIADNLKNETHREIAEKTVDASKELIEELIKDEEADKEIELIGDEAVA